MKESRLNEVCKVILKRVKQKELVEIITVIRGNRRLYLLLRSFPPNSSCVSLPAFCCCKDSSFLSSLQCDKGLLCSFFSFHASKCTFLWCCKKIQRFQHGHKFCLCDLKIIADRQVAFFRYEWLTHSRFFVKTTFQIQFLQPPDCKQLCRLCACLMEQLMILFR